MDNSQHAPTTRDAPTIRADRRISVHALLIESHEAEGADWGVSFDGPNPAIEQYVQCASKEDAVRLMGLLDSLITSIHPNHAG